MDLSTTLAIVQTILTAIQTLAELHSMISFSNCKSELDDLQNTVETVRAVLVDADARQDCLNDQEKNYIQKLKDAVYDADDVLDEFLTLAKQMQLETNKVKSFFSWFKLLTHRLSSKVNMVNDKLNKIASKSHKFSFKVDYDPIKFTKEETSSCLSDVIIGREEDVEKIVGVLLGSHNVDQPNVSLLAIVGMGGLGKTALAQLVFNDPRITEAFQLKRWTCIADQDQKHLDLKGHLGKVVEEVSVRDLSLEDIHHKVKEQLGGKKYLLVLDDVWTESYDEWQRFEEFFKVGGRGSWIIVTTRSKTTAQLIGGDQVHELRGLSEPESWNLFERMAFQAEQRDDELVKLGKEIVKKCTNVPLALRLVGSLLRGQPKSKWLSFHNEGLDYLSKTNDTMTCILKLSYDQLNPPLKACFAYCAIFPKDWEISKEMLIRLWMAQGYINSENFGEEYFLILLQRCFFQDICKDKFGGIESFKIHDLLHDIAEKVAGEEICRFSFVPSNVGKRVRHLSFKSNPEAQHILSNTHVRTCLRIERLMAPVPSNQSIIKWTRLRSLDFSCLNAKSLPKSIGQLLHLRSLDLSCSSVEVLPKSITKLVNLQTLDLHFCICLKQLPDDVSKLVDLSTLNIAGCYFLERMPENISMLTCLHTLCEFVVGVKANSTPRQCFNGLEDLQHLNKLKGKLAIQIAVPKNAKFVKEEHGGGGYLRSKEHLETILINFKNWNKEYGSKESEQALLEEMQPHCNVKALALKGYHGETMPRWPGRGDSSTLFDLPNLVTLEIINCSKLIYLPWQIGKLPHLKTLAIFGLSKMEYVVDADSKTLVSGGGSSFFPSLNILDISMVPKLKGWWRRTESGSHVVNPNDGGSSREANLEWVSSPCFPLLRKLALADCEKMMFVPLCPQLEYLTIYDSIRYMSVISHQPPLSYPKLKRLKINNLEWLKSTPIEYFQFVVQIHIWDNERMERLGEVTEFPTYLFSSVQSLRIEKCPKLKSVRGWLEHLSALEYLEIVNCPKVELSEMSWYNLAATLQTLYLVGFEEMEELPEGIQYCTSLRSLNIYDSSKLKSVPKWMPKLTSLQKLHLRECSKSLIERCQQPNGEDWPLIQHIAKLEIS